MHIIAEKPVLKTISTCEKVSTFCWVQLLLVRSLLLLTKNQLRKIQENADLSPVEEKSNLILIEIKVKQCVNFHIKLVFCTNIKQRIFFKCKV